MARRSRHPNVATWDDAAELRRIRFRSENFRELQGLRLLPVALYLLLITAIFQNALFRLLNAWSDFWRAMALFAMLPALLLILFYGMDRFYDLRFGRTESKSGSRGELVRFSMMCVLWWVLTIVEHRGELRISLVGLAMAVYFARRPGAWRERPYCGALAIVFCAAGFLVGGGGLPVSQIELKAGVLGYGYAELLRFFFALGLIVQGLLDHRLLSRNLPPPPAEE